MDAVEIRTLDDLRNVVRRERRRRRMSQSQAAGLIGHTQKWLSDFERGATSPPADMVLRLLLLLGIKLYAEPPGAAEGDVEDAGIGLEVDL